MGAALRRLAAIALVVWAIALFTLAAAYALPGGPQAALSVDDASPVVGQGVHFNASASTGHDAGNGRIVAYAFTFGDGDGTDWQASPEANHTYAAEGVVTATVTVKDARGSQAQATVGLRVQPLPPPSGGTPDLIPVRATFSPPRPEENATVVLSVVLLNRGGVAAESARIEVTDHRPNGSVVPLEGPPVTGPIAPGATTTLTGKPFPVEGVGNHTVTIVVSEVTPAEPDPTDNVLHVTLTVVPAGTNVSVGPLSVSPLIVVIAGAAVAAAAGAGFLLRRPKSPGPPQPPPPEPQDFSPPPIWPP